MLELIGFIAVALTVLFLSILLYNRLGITDNYENIKFKNRLVEILKS